MAFWKRRSLDALDVNVEVPTTSSAAQQRDTWRAVLDGMREGVWVTDADGVIVDHNRALKEMLFTTRELRGLRPVEIVRNPQLAEAVKLACQNQSTSLEITVEGMRPRMLNVTVGPLGLELAGSLAVFYDVTELKRLEQVRKDFVANVSHELRTPITAIQGYAETLQDGAWKDPHHAPEMIAIIHRQATRLAALVDDLLDLSKIESKEFELHPERVDLVPVIRRAIDAVRPKAEQKHIRLLQELSEDVAAVVDPQAMEQVVLNLLDNALKYNSPQGQVTVRLVVLDGGVVTLEVEDTGMGIEASQLDRIFERFYRVDKGRSRESGGTGLGLSIVKHLVHAMHGRIDVHSEVGKGTRFRVTLPS